MRDELNHAALVLLRFRDDSRPLSADTPAADGAHPADNARAKRVLMARENVRARDALVVEEEGEEGGLDERKQRDNADQRRYEAERKADWSAPSTDTMISMRVASTYLYPGDRIIWPSAERRRECAKRPTKTAERKAVPKLTCSGKDEVSTVCNRLEHQHRQTTRTRSRASFSAATCFAAGKAPVKRVAASSSEDLLLALLTVGDESSGAGRARARDRREDERCCIKA